MTGKTFYKYEGKSLLTMVCSTHTHLVVSTLRETLVLSFAGKDMITHVEPSVAGFATHVPTYAVGNVPRRQTTTSGGRTTSSYVDSPLVVQITAEGVRLVEYDATLNGFTPFGAGWYPKKSGDASLAGKDIVAAAMSPSQFVVGLSGGRLALLNLGANDALQVVKCVSHPHFPSTHVADPIPQDT